ncbi:hypothetical protein Bca52824_026647 [Brassica carinata]|uniref:Uncharacterized protein n=1 Tax=Brassica carinata TaxID=52824 RepID=A0A8X7V904_BRACI|nr:hypothetical protein Bca52824_026647 [Brassica carinata]
MVSRVKQGSMSVSDCAEFFLCQQIMKKKNKHDLIQIALDGLKEEIRDSLESTEKTRPKSFTDSEDEDPWDEPRDDDSEESDDEDNIEEWAYEEETRVEVDEDEMSDHGSDEKTRMSTVLSSLDEETDHGPDENTHDSSGAGEACSEPEASGSVADPSPSIVGSSASVADPSPSGRRSVADSSTSVSGSVDDSSASVVVK